MQAETGQQYGLTQGQEEDMNVQIAAGAKGSMQSLDTEIELGNSTQLEMQQVLGQVAADNQAYFAQQESDFNAAQGLRDLAINGEYSIQTGLNQSLQKSLANLQVPQVNFSVNSGATAADQVDYNPSTFYGDLQMRRQLESQGLSVDQIDARMAAFENPPATTSNPPSDTALNNLLNNAPLEELLATPPSKGPFIGPIDYAAQARLQEQQNVLGALVAGPVFGGGTYFAARAAGASDQAAANLATLQIGLLPASPGLTGELDLSRVAVDQAVEGVVQHWYYPEIY